MACALVSHRQKRQPLASLVGVTPEVAQETAGLQSLLSERLHYYETRIEDVTLKGVPARLASLILFLVESEGVQVPGEIRIPTRYTHEHLGTMIGANREAVTRAFGRLQDEGALQIRRRLIYVDDVEALERVAGRLLEEEREGLS
jgi:CRP-like cAMP-binding protein